MAFLVLAAMGGGRMAEAEAASASVWKVGIEDGSSDEFSEEWMVDADFTVGEPATGLARAVSRDDGTMRIHFDADAAARGSMARWRIRVAFIGPGWMDPAGIWLGNGWHDLRVSLNGVVLRNLPAVAEESRTLVIEADAAQLTLLAANNILTIQRTGGANSTPAGAPAWSWMGLDYVALDVDPAGLQDLDGDGLPAWWEQEHHRKDAPGQGNAVQDPDHDGLTDFAEFSNRTDPDNADSDGDGLKDGVEVLTIPSSDPLLADSDGDGLTDAMEKYATPATNPRLADTDSDGAGDAWERQARTDGASGLSVPPVFKQALGLDFVQRSGGPGVAGAWEVAGVVPQPFWNRTFPAAPWSETIGRMNQIAGPQAGLLVDSAGAVSPVTAMWSSPYAGFNNNGGAPDGKLLNGFLTASETVPASVTLSGIRWAKYDVIVCLAAGADQFRGSAEVAGLAATRRYFLTESMAPFRCYREATTTQAEVDSAVAGAGGPEETERRMQSVCRSGNFVRFRNLSAASVTVEVRQGLWGAGISAVQVVDTAADRDGDGLPDSYEFEYGLLVSTNDSARDPDMDGKTNAAEYAEGTDPRVSDSDGDGLADGAETVGNGMKTDSDGDGLSDSEEVLAARPTNPNAADSDGDGLGDAEENAIFSDPLTVGGAARPVPVYTASGASGFPEWNWTVDLQLVIDHARALTDAGGYGPRALTSLTVFDAVDFSDSALSMELRMDRDRMSWLFHTGRDGAFSAAGDPANAGWYAEWTAPPDLTALLGFSGYGRADVSGRLRMQVGAIRPGGANQWNLEFKILNLDRPPGAREVLVRTFSNATGSARIMSGTTQWVNAPYDPIIVVRPGLYTLPGVAAYFGYPALETLPAFAAVRDSDDDGMSDAWEDSHGFNKLSAADAALDADADGLVNRAEFLSGTSAGAADSDGDGVRDADEIAGGSNPLLATSRPAFFTTGPPAGGDFNHNGMSDVWEMWMRDFSLTASGDADGDGYSNLEESWIGTNALDAGSWLTMDWEKISPTRLRLRWDDIPGKTHRVFRSVDNLNWQPLAAVPAVVGGRRTMVVPHPVADAAARAFFRVAVTDADADGDGVNDWAEARLGSDPGNADSLSGPAARDTDGDGLADQFLSGDYASLAARMLGGGTDGSGYSGQPGTGISRPQASRLLAQASFGATMEDIDEVVRLGARGWIQDQLARAPSYHSPYIRRIQADYFGSRTDFTYNGSAQDRFLYGNNISTPFFQTAVGAPDQLRQRVAFALSQILVASRREAALESVPLAMSDFYDIFVGNAFGNYEDILLAVSLHPVMGRYLSHLGNQKAVPETNQYPDENYAREIMQLFSIGQWELNPDGSRKTTPAGDPIPTYDNSRITAMARVFTGLWFSGQDWLQGGYNDAGYLRPMTLFPERHDFAAKELLGGWTIPERAPTAENGMRDVREAVRCLFLHPNTPVFISRQLIQFLVTSNPTPAYVSRVQAVFVNNGSGVRGDLGAVVKAILLDPEARDPRWSMGDPDFGKLKEPLIRSLHLARVGGMGRRPGAVWWNWGDFFEAMKQEVMYSPSVFNFYRPDYRAPGLLSEKNLSGPVFQITDSSTSISVPNLYWEFIHNGLTPSHDVTYPLDFAAEQSMAGNPAALVDRLNLLFCAGRMSAGSRAVILSAVEEIPATDPRSRVHLAVYLCLTAPEGAVQR
ncbi:MAG: hypothetical protein JWL81_3455 [Verrucomicrobiales bacterium]|nr:hypothetical protein [Verrucomicrobiales bacterium]